MRARFIIPSILFLAAAGTTYADRTVGTVRAKAADFVFVQPEGDAGRRYYFKPAATRPDALRDAADSLAAGDTIEVDWTDGPRRTIDAIKRVLRPASTPAAPASAPASVADRPAAPSPSTAGPRSTTGEAVNAGIDDLLAVGTRLVDLPAFVLLAAFAGIAAGLIAITRRFESAARPRAATRCRRGIAVLAVLGTALVFDRKLVALQRDVQALNGRITASALCAAAPAGGTAAGASGYLFDLAAAQASLATHFKDVTLKPSVYDTASNVVRIGIGDPLVQAYLTVIDLSNPAVGVKLGTDLDAKTLTSDFAKANDCTIAINGEAGRSPAMNSGLGTWQGYLVQNGNVLLKEDPKVPRPFIGFGPDRRAVFRPASAADRTLPAALPDVIWGRLDSITDGVVQTADERYRQPRTAMGVSRDGTKLYLLVIDGRQSRYSVGVTRAEVGYLLQAFGAYQAMLCDEGGSSCLYLKRTGGIVNSPSDGDERPTYTHFGITLHAP